MGQIVAPPERYWISDEVYLPKVIVSNGSGLSLWVRVQVGTEQLANGKSGSSIDLVLGTGRGNRPVFWFLAAVRFDLL